MENSRPVEDINLEIRTRDSIEFALINRLNAKQIEGLLKGWSESQEVIDGVKEAIEGLDFIHGKVKTAKYGRPLSVHEVQYRNYNSSVVRLKALSQFREGRILTPDQKSSLFTTLENRLAANPERYSNIQWERVKSALEKADSRVIFGLFQMEESGHEVGISKARKAEVDGYRFDSCCKEPPLSSRNFFYSEASEIARLWGVELMDCDTYKKLHKEIGIDSHPITNYSSYLKGGMIGYPDYRRHHEYSRSTMQGFRCSAWIPEA